MIYQKRNNEATGSRAGVVLRTSHLMRWAEEAASGMEYIHSKGLVHRDIALRNTLLAIHPDHNQECDCLDPSILVAKISDFGLSKDLHELSKDYYQIVIHTDPQQNRPHKLPLRWLAIESLETLRFTKESDCWTFGVALYELFTLGHIPYENEIERNYEGDLRLKLISHLRQSENILPEPEYVPNEMYVKNNLFLQVILISKIINFKFLFKMGTYEVMLEFFTRPASKLSGNETKVT